MIKIICLIVLAFCILPTHVAYTTSTNNIYTGENMEIIELLDEVKSVNVYDNGITTKFTDNFDTYISSLKNILDDAREMPSLGVALHRETLDAMKSGFWIEYIFDNTKSHNDMLFDSLLIKVEDNSYGLSIIRKYQGKYDGRCFYFDVDTPINMADFK